MSIKSQSDECGCTQIKNQQVQCVRLCIENKSIMFKTVKFVLAASAVATLVACGGGGGAAPAAAATTLATSSNVPAALQSLIGRVTLNYKFSISSIPYTNTSDYKASSLNSDSTLLIAPSLPMGNMACGLAPSGTGKQFLCLIINPSTSMDAFLIDVASSIISGSYTFCSAGTTTSNCAAKMLISPSGTVTGSVVALAGGIEVLPIQSNLIDVGSIETIKSVANGEQFLPQSITPEIQSLSDALGNSMVDIYANASARKP